MTNKQPLFNITVLAAAVPALSGLAFIMIALPIYKEPFFAQRGTGGAAGFLVLLGFVILLGFDLTALVWQLDRIRRRALRGAASAAPPALGALCLILFAGIKTMIDEIGRETRLGWGTIGEWIILYAMLAVQAAYILVVLFQLFREFKAGRPADGIPPLRDESVFLAAQFIGITCGMAGLWLNLSFFLRQHQIRQFRFLLPFYILILCPYGVTALYWIAMRLKEPVREWYDELQWRSVALAGLITLLLSIPGTAVLFLFGQATRFFWFPHYLFLILTIFSAANYFLFRNAD